MNRSVEQYLRAFTHAKPSRWVSLLGWAEYCLDTSHHSGIKMTPFQALYGRAPPTILQYQKNSTTNQALDDMLSEWDQLLKTLKQNLKEAQHRMEQ